MIKKIKLIIIDFDDCLCQTEAACFEFENKIVEKMGFLPMTHSQHIASWGEPIKKAITERVSGINPDEFMTEFKKSLKQLKDEGLFDPIDASVIKTLQTLRSEQRHLVVLTSRIKEEVAHLMKYPHPLNDLIEKWYYQEVSFAESGVIKPNPLVITPILRTFQVKPENVMYVGDSVSDATCAQGAEIPFVANLESGLRKVSDFNGIPVKYFISKFSELSDVIKKYEHI